MDWLSAFLGITLAFTQPAGVYAPIHPDDSNQSFYELNVEAGVILFDFIQVDGTVQTWMDDNDDTIQFSPFETQYFIGASVFYGPFRLGFEHLCIHEIEKNPRPGRTGGYHRFYLDFRTEFN